MIHRNEIPVGVDAIIDYMQTRLSTFEYTDINASTSSFFDEIYPLTYKNSDNKPIWYSNQRNDYVGVAPDDNHKNVSWFYLEGSANQISYNTEQAQCNLIVWFRSKDIDVKVNNMTKHIANFLRNEFFRKTNGSFQNPEYFFNREDVFSEYDFNNEFLKIYSPFSAFRVRFDLIYKFECKPTFTQSSIGC